MSSTYIPIEASIDYSLLQDILSSSEPFDQAYFSEPYHTSPDYPLDPFLDPDAFSPTVPTFEAPNIDPASLSHTPQDASTSPLTSTAIPTRGPSPPSPTPPSSLSNPLPASHPPSKSPTHSPASSPRNLKHSPSPSATEPPSKRRATANETPRPHRQPHNQVERKYRQGLNAALEQLRRAVPSLRDSSTAENASGQVRISKATVLVRAMEYIHAVERERDGLREEVEVWKGRGKRLGWEEEKEVEEDGMDW